MKTKKIKGLVVGIFSAVLLLSGGIGGVWFAKEKKLNQLQQTAMQELIENKGDYDESKIVLYDTSQSEAQFLAGKFNAKLRITDDGKFATLTLPDGMTVEDVYAARENRQYLSELSLDYKAKTSELEETLERLPSAPNYTVSDTYYAQQSYFNYLNVGDAWTKTRGNGVTVAVIDTGIDTDHSEFIGKISEYSYNATEDKIVKDYVLENGEYDWSIVEDEQGHGTAVAGTVAAAMDGNGVIGVASQASLLVIKVECDANGNFYNTSDLVFGLYYAIERDVDVVNMSFGAQTPDNPFAAATKLAVDSDIVCVAAAGNSGNANITYPAADEHVLGVGALETDGWELADYSNYGENVNLVAPGTVLTTKIGGDYGVINGTSFSSPIVAGAVALYKTQDKYATFAKVQELLYASAYDLGALGCDWEYGYGALDINALICEEKGTVTFDMLTDELDDIEQIFVRNHTLQNLPEPERTYAVFDGWYYDIHCTEELNWYEDVFTTDLTLYANWVNEEDGVPYTYVTLDDGTVEIRSYTGKRRYITIPDQIEGKTVSSIGDFAFKGQSRLREVNLPRGLKNIGQEAFANCNNLIQMEIPEGVTKIGASAFKNNVRLSSVAFTGNSKLQTIGAMAFAGCSKLQRFEIPKTVTSVDGSAFYGATRLQSITVKEGNTSFVAKNDVLYNYTSSMLVAYPAGLHTDCFTLPANVREIGSYAFAFAPIANVELSNVQTIGGAAFEHSKLGSVAIPDSVTAMGVSAFAYSECLKEATLGNGLSTISGFAFYLTGLRSIQIPANIQSIGGSAFAATGSLTSVTFESGSKLAVIGGGAFLDSSIENIEIPQSVVSIGDKAFAKFMNVYALKEVAFEENSRLQSIGNNAFEKNVALSAIVLPENLRTIGAYAFMNTGLVTVEIPASVTTLGVGAFASCHSLTAIEVAEGNTVYQDVDGVVYDIPMSEIIAYPAGNTATSYAVLNGVKKIGDAAFYGAYNLTSVILPDGLTTVGEYGFYECIKVTGYTLPTTLTAIEQYAFAYNVALSRIVIPDNVIQIGRYAFAYDWNCKQITFNSTSKLPRISFAAFAYTGITSFRVPANVSTIAQYAFTGCDSLTSVTFAANSKLTSISAYMFQGCDTIRTITFENGSALTSIQAHGLEGMRNLTTVNFGDAKVTNIDNYAFRYNEKLTNITIPETVTYIGRYAFYGDKALTSLTLSENIDYIGKYAFYHANNLNVYFKAEVLPENLQEYWDEGIKGYYVGVTNVVTSEDGNWDYATLASGGISIIKYKGAETAVDLTAVDLGGDIVSIGGYAFYNTAIESIVLPETLTTIGRYAFGRSKLTAIDIPANVEFIGNNAFFNVKTLQSVTFAQNGNLRQIEQYAFAYTESLLNAYLPASLEKLGSYSFFESGLQNLTFANGSVLTEISEGAFQKTSITGVTLPDSVNYISDSAFRDCLALQTVNFGTAENIQIHSNAFYNTGITTLYIPENIEYIGEYAFVGLENLTAYEVAEGNPYYASVDGILYNKEVEKVIAVPAARTGKITLPQTVENLGFGAFENSDVTEVEFAEGSNILTFGYRAFYGADYLTTFTVPASVVSIDFYAFANCDRLETVLFEEGSRLTGIYEGAFYGCKSLKNITLPDSIVEISDFAFYGCTSLDRIPVSETNELKGIYDYAFAYTGITELTIPETVIDIGAYAFKGIKIKELTIPETNKYDLMIGIGAFEGCEVTEVTLPFIGASYEDDETTWFGYIFGAGGYEANSTYVPDSLKTVTITEGITFIGRNAFYELTDFDLSVPHSVTMLYNNCFYGSNVRYQLTNTISVDSTTLSSSAVGGASAETAYFGIGIYGQLKLAEGLRSIGYQAFAGQGSGRIIKHLTNIIIPDSVISIGDSAFEDCNGLMSITIGNSVTSIGKEAFSGCSGLIEIEIPDSVMSIGDSAFGSEYLYRVINNSAYLSLEDYSAVVGTNEYGGLFRHAKEIVDNVSGNTYTLEDGSSYIETKDGFHFLTELDSSGNTIYKLVAYSGMEDTVILPTDINGNEYIIYKIRGVKNVIIPQGVTSIAPQAFYGCSSLTSVEIPDSVTSIGYWAFEKCSSLTNIIIPDSITWIGDHAFSHCSSLMSVTFGENSQLTSIGSQMFCDCSSLTEIIIPDSVTRIGSAFFGCSSLTSIVIPDGVTSIGRQAFQSCSSLTEIVIPDSVTSIDDAAFLGCKGLKSINLPDNVTSIGSQAFYGCSSLTSIEIPEGVRSIGGGAFNGCPIRDIIIDEGNTALIYKGGILYNKEMTRVMMALDTITSVIIPATVTDISMAFSDCSNLRTVAFEKGSQLTSIGDGAFTGCDSLKEIVIPDGVTSIGSAFQLCHSLTSVIIPDSVISISSGAFVNCSSLYQVINNSEYLSLEDYSMVVGTWQYGSLFKNAKKIVDNVSGKTYTYENGYAYIDTDDGFRFRFEQDSTGNTIYKLTAYLGTEDTVTLPLDISGNNYSIYQMRGVRNVIIPEGMTNIGWATFEGCSSLTNIEIPDSVTSIGSYAFHNCESLEKIVIPDSVTSIEHGAFLGCSSLTEIVIPDSVTSITYDAFEGTAFYNDASNWKDGMLYCGKHLIAVDTSATHITLREDTGAIASDAFSECYSLKYLSGLGGNHNSLLSSLTNLETLILTEMPTHNISSYFGASIPITLKNIVLKDSVMLTSTSYSYNPFVYITGVTIYVEANEQDVMWDDDYQNWHNGNTVYYGEDWITASFYGENGELLDESIYLNTQVVRIPYVSSYGDEQYTYVLDGWDLDGDGVTDSLPATSNVDIVGNVIMKQVVNTYTVTFLDKDGKTALYSYVLPYGTEITLPETPAKDGYTFLGWSGYTEGMTVTGDITFSSKWQHNGDGHVYGEPVWVEPTCEEQGYNKHECTLCGEWYGTDYVDAVGHSYSFAETVAPTCLAEGYDLYACACGASYKDNFVEETGHYFGVWIVDEDATCLGSGKQHRDCYTCGHSESEGILAHGHAYVGTVTKAATCTQYGEMVYTCEYCGDSIKEYTPMTAHNYRQKMVAKSWLQWIIDMLLNAFYGYEGNTAYYYECVDCRHVQTLGESLYSVSSVQSTCAHELGDWTEVLAATCEGQGVLGRVCSKCNEVVEAQTFDALGHDYSNVVVVAPDCEHQGYTLHTCVTCGDYYANAFVDANGHTTSDWLVDVEAGCENVGSKHTECTVCGEILAIAEIPAIGHTEVVDNAVAATCTTTGLTAGKHCEVCGKVLVAQELVEKLAHTESNWLVDVEATCENVGSKHMECTVCGEILQIEEISATGHTEAVDNAVAATCTTTGLTAGKHCSVCGKILVAQEVVAKMNHTESDWLVDVAAGCENVGSKHTECTVCGEILAIAEISATGHTEVVDNAVSATCTATGLTAGKHCEVCGKVLVTQELVEKLAHTQSNWIVDVEAGCENAGSKHTECTVCDEILAIAEISATGHTEVVDNAVSATCTATGLTAGKHCEVCGKVLVTQEVVAKLNHTESEWIVDVAATCENAGSKHTECTVCGEILAIAEMPATGHDVGDWIVDQEPTQGESGYRHKECSKCGKQMDGELIDALPVPSKGCGSSITGISFGSMILLGAAGLLFMRKRKKS